MSAKIICFFDTNTDFFFFFVRVNIFLFTFVAPFVIINPSINPKISTIMTIYKCESVDGSEDVRYFLSYQSLMRYQRQKDPVFMRLVGIYGYEVAPSRFNFFRIMRIKQCVDMYVYVAVDERTGKHKRYYYRVTSIKAI